MGTTNPLTVPGSSIVRQVAWLAIPVLIEQALLYLVGAVGYDPDRPLPVGGASRGGDGRGLPALVPGEPADGRLGGGDRAGGPADRLESARVGAADRPAGDAHGLGRRRPDDGAGGESRPVRIRRPESARRGGSVRGAVPADRADGGAAGGLHDGGGRLLARGRRHPDRDVGDDPGQRDQYRRRAGRWSWASARCRSWDFAGSRRGRPSPKVWEGSSC